MTNVPPPPPDAVPPSVPAAVPPSAPPPPPPPPPPSLASAVPTADWAPAPMASGPGPVGKSRSAGLVILLTIVTLGIWTIVWSYQNGEELKAYARTGIGGVGYLFITFFIAPATMFLMASEVEQIYRREGKEPPITTIWGLWFLLPIIGNFIWYLRIQRSINELWAAHGGDAPSGV